MLIARPALLTADQIRARLARFAASGEPPVIRLDQKAADGPAPALVPAAVLIPLIERPEGLFVLLTQRSADLRSHSGQVSFPGGRSDPGDPDVVATALRETAEEIGLDAARVDILGRFETVVTHSSYRLATVVGLARPPLDLRVNHHEVDAVFEVPLDLIRDPAHHALRQLVFAGQTRESYVVPWPDRLIWGITAAILVRFGRFLADPET